MRIIRERLFNAGKKPHSLRLTEDPEAYIIEELDLSSKHGQELVQAEFFLKEKEPKADKLAWDRFEHRLKQLALA